MIQIRLGSSELSTAKSEQRKAIALAANVEQRKSECKESDWREEEQVESKKQEQFETKHTAICGQREAKSI